jgi:hypothetical protein
MLVISLVYWLLWSRFFLDGHGFMNSCMFTYVISHLFRLQFGCSGTVAETLSQGIWRIPVLSYRWSFETVRAVAYQLRQDKHQDTRKKKQKLTSALWLRPMCGGFYNLIRFNCALFFASCRRRRVLILRAAAHQLRQDKHQDMRKKKQKLTSALWLRPMCGGFYNLIRFNCAPFFASCRRHRVLTVTCLDACQCAAYLTCLDACRCAAYRMSTDVKYSIDQ